MADAQREQAQPWTGDNKQRTCNSNNGQYTNWNYPRGSACNKEFKGASPKIGGVLCAPAETHIDARGGYLKFIDLLNNYIFKHMMNAVEIVALLEKGINPVSQFEKNNIALLNKKIPRSKSKSKEVDFIY